MDVFDFSQTQNVKKIKKKVEVVRTVPGDPDIQSKNKEQYFQSLDRLTQLLKENNPQLATQTNINIEKPQIDKLGTKKSLWKNFETICNEMKRDPHHVCQYFLIELGTEGSLTDGKLILKGKYISNNIEILIKRYMHEYVLCHLCKSQNTLLNRDAESRLYSKECNNCKAAKTVTTLKMNKRVR